MKYNTSSKVEAYFNDLHQDFALSSKYRRISTIIVDNYIELGQLTALRFLEWVGLNPGGVIALPTGKTPEFFIKWVQFYLANWKKEMENGILGKIGIDKNLKPDLRSLEFFQLDEFFPIKPEHERSFTYFVKNFYIDNFGLDPKKVHLINTYDIPEKAKQDYGKIQNLDEVFPDGVIDLGLRITKPKNERDLLKQKTIKLFDQFCQDYEDEIRKRGGIGFFLGGIGPDGHIAFNVKGSAHHSHTRLTNINYETQAAAATDLGGIELVRKKAVITIGLDTITYNPDTVAIVIAAGQAKSEQVYNAVEREAGITYPATSLQKLKNARFYVTQSATAMLTISEENIKQLYKDKKLPSNYSEKLIISGSDANKLSLIEASRIDCDSKAVDTPEWKIACEIRSKPLDKLSEETYRSLVEKIQKGIDVPDNQRILHTAPHHDDIELAYFPLLHHLVRSPNNENYFVYCTSGFTAVTNFYVTERLENLQMLLASGRIADEQKRLADFGNAQDDITGYLNGIALQNEEIQHFHISTRLTRLFLNHLKTNDLQKLATYIGELLTQLQAIEPGRSEPSIFHLIKGWLREYEAELVWAYFGIDMDHVSHLRLPFYSANIFPEYPNIEQDVMPIVALLERIRPTIITLALDPEGSGPDTHYKTLIALSEAIDRYVAIHPEMNIRIWGYRNIWSRYALTEVNTIVPVSLNSFAVLHNMFNSCFLSQKSASFPSYELDGTFSELAQKIWVGQLNHLIDLLGKEFFYGSTNPLLRRSYGAIYLKDMSYREFTDYLVPVRRLLKAKEMLGGSSEK
jgi:glucosamine-6-phosphate deaminase